MDTDKNKIIIALMVAMFLAAIEVTVVTTAIPTIAKDLKNLEIISWVFSMYLFTSAISTPIYGKLSDLYGRKNMLSIGIVIFIIGSSLCGISATMYQLIAFRALQGLGAGAIFTVTYAIVGDVFPLGESAKMQGWLNLTWGIASIVGPFMGGFLIDFFSWKWIFLINLPFGILSVILLQSGLKEKFAKREHRIDYLGTLVLSASIIALLYGIMLGEKGGNWLAPSVLMLLTLAPALLVLFYFVERRVKEPVVPFDIFTKNNIFANGVTLLLCAILIGINVYIPIYIQSVLGFSATVSGLSLAPLSVAWLLSSLLLGKAIPRYGERTVVAIFTFVMLLSNLLLPLFGLTTPLMLVMVYSFIVGFGFGGAWTTVIIVIQSSVEYDKRGAAMGINSLVKTLGQTVSVSIFGTLFNFHITEYFSGMGIRGVKPDDLYSRVGILGGLNPEQVVGSLMSAVQIIFIILLFISVVAFLLSFTLAGSLKETR